MSASICALLGFTAWTVALVGLVLLYRISKVFTFQLPANSWPRGGAGPAGEPGLLTRVGHAHLNSLEMLPVVAAVILAAQVMGKGDVTDAYNLPCILLGARIAQSAVHMISVSATMVFIRANFFTIQLGIIAYWLLRLTGAI